MKEKNNLASPREKGIRQLTRIEKARMAMGLNYVTENDRRAHKFANWFLSLSFSPLPPLFIAFGL